MEMEYTAVLIDRILRRVEIISDTEYKIDPSFKQEIQAEVEKLCNKYPIT
jgi:hypothetical protein